MLLQPLEVSYELAAAPDDEKMIQVTVRSMKIALSTAKRYENAVEEQKAALVQGKDFYVRYGEASGFVEDNAKAGLWNSWVAAGVGGIAGMLLGILISFLGR